MSVLELKNVTYQYEGTTNTVLKNVDAAFDTGKVYAIVGKSGSGKSTLLSLIAGLDVCTSGEICYKDKSLKQLDRDKYRSKDIGVIFQAYNLLSNASAVDNVVLSMNISEIKAKDKIAIAYDLLGKVEVDQQTASRKVLKLSGGEQQRVGIARALSHNPDIILADEPTGNLDSDTEDGVLEILASLARKENKCVIIVTHTKKVADIADVVYGMKEGRLTLMNKPA